MLQDQRQTGYIVGFEQTFSMALRKLGKMFKTASAKTWSKALSKDTIASFLGGSPFCVQENMALIQCYYYFEEHRRISSSSFVKLSLVFELWLAAWPGEVALGPLPTECASAASVSGAAGKLWC